MAKLLLITDSHFGLANGSEVFHDNMKLFYSEVFFPFLDKHITELTGIVHLGDVFHDRRKIDTLTAKLSREYFFAPLDKILADNNKKLHIIAGNHDSFFRDELDTNALSEFIVRQNYNGLSKKTIEIYTASTEIPAWNCVFIPWIVKSNREETQNLLAKTCMKHALGHLELLGFNFSKVQVAMHGDDPQNFLKFNRVLSGHYHYKHQKGNVVYLGSPTQQTWIDVNTPKGFHIFDTNTNELEFINNPYNMFEEISIHSAIDTSINHPRFYRVIINEEMKQSDIDNYIKKLYDNNAINVTIKSNIFKKSTKSSTNDDLVLEDVESTPKFIESFVEDKEVSKVIMNLYNRAVSVEV